MVRPLSSFCCGCPLTFGVKLVIFFHFAQCVFYIIITFCNIVLKIPTFNFNLNLATQTFNAAFCLVGLPFICSAVWGVLYRLETHLRLYLAYLSLALVLDMVYIVVFFIMEDVCANMPDTLAQHGAAFACGSMRIFSLLFILLVFVVEIYCMFTVWSLCEDFKAGGAGIGLPQLLVGYSELPSKKNRQATGYGDWGKGGILGSSFGGHGSFGGYGAAGHPGLGGSQRIFGGYGHDTDYPPMR